MSCCTKRSARSEGGWGDGEPVKGERDGEFVTERDGEFVAERDGEFVAERDEEFVAERDGRFVAGEGVSNADIGRFLEGEAMGDRIG